MTPEKFKEIANEYGALNSNNQDYLTETGFVNYFCQFFTEFDKDRINDIFETLGYENDLTN